MNGGPLVTTTNRREHMVSQPCQIRFQAAEDQWCGEDSRERFVPVQEMLGIPAHYQINRIQQSLQITLLNKGCSQIRHDDIAHEHNFFIRKINQHGIMRLAPSSRDQFELRSADVQLCPIVDRNIWLVAQNLLRAEALSEELLREDVGPVEFLSILFL